MLVRGIRGATTAEANTREAILDATRELFAALIEANSIDHELVASVIFSTSPDLNAEFPAVAAREAGWTDVALMCGHEMGVPGSLQRCVRILIYVNTELRLSELKHIYLRGAQVLRPDLVSGAAPVASNGARPPTGANPTSTTATQSSASQATTEAAR